MSNALAVAPPPDQAERNRALDVTRSVLVEAPAGSGKTDLLTRRFLRLLAEVDEPGQVVAITFTKAAASEMRHRILAELERASRRRGEPEADELSMEALAAQALERSRRLGWNLLELPAQLRISTIDSFCRELAIQRPLLGGLGGGLDIDEDPAELYRRAARKTLEQIDKGDPELRAAIETLLLWRDNGWQEMEKLLVEMLAKRDRWMQQFVFDRELDRDALRERLERPFARAAQAKLEKLSALLDQVPHAREEALELARFACGHCGGSRHRGLAELASFPMTPFDDAEALEEARQACNCLAGLLLTQDGGFRRRIDKTLGFPRDRRLEKARLAALIADLRAVPGFESTLASVGDLPPARYTEEDWQIVLACFVLLRHAVGQLKVEFAEAGAVDYTEISQIALQVLRGEEGIPGEGALAAADGIRHLLVDEFQDTSRRQHELLGRIISAWPEREDRTCFVVGDPMQSIYFFRDADAELFPQVRDSGLMIPEDQPLPLDCAALRTNFRTAPPLVERLNGLFTAVFDEDDGSGVRFTPAESPQKIAGPVLVEQVPRLRLHFGFMPCTPRGPLRSQANGCIKAQRMAAHEKQLAEIAELIGSHAQPLEAARAEGRKYRIAVLARAHSALTPIAEALRAAGIPFRAVELEKLKERPEVMDALAIARALMNPQDRLAWLALLRAPWCGLSLADLHMLVSADDPELLNRPVRELIAERVRLLTGRGRTAAERVLRAVETGEKYRAAQPAVALGTWIEHVWLLLGGAECVDESARANVDLLWRCLDGLPEGEVGVQGSSLDAALDKLTALPDSRVSGDCGVQLMTIHKAKGLEFEVVIVPEMQAAGGKVRFDLLAWMERGMPVPDDSGEVTEFLVAPIPVKGGESTGTRKWVNREYRNRELQEARRVLYVAATRAREELHFFARPEYRTEANGSWTLMEPGDCLLKTAWPAIDDEVRRQFEEWAASREAETGDVAEIAATAEENSPEMPVGPKSTVLRRLPENYRVEERTDTTAPVEMISGIGAEPLYRRHEGGLQSRALGIAVHSVFEELARLRATNDWETARKAVVEIKPRLIAEARVVGLDPVQAQRVAAHSFELALDASQDAVAQWIMAPHAESGSEQRWAGLDSGRVRVVQVDRVFRAGLDPVSEGDEAWWIIDYKTAHAVGLEPKQAMPELRAVFAPQLEAYARVLRGLHGADAVIRAGLYYPRMKIFDWWVIG